MDKKETLKKEAGPGEEKWVDMLDRLFAYRETELFPDEKDGSGVWAIDIGDNAQLVLWLARTVDGGWRWTLLPPGVRERVDIVAALCSHRTLKTLTNALHLAYMEIMSLVDSAMDIMDVLKADAGIKKRSRARTRTRV